MVGDQQIHQGKDGIELHDLMVCGNSEARVLILTLQSLASTALSEGSMRRVTGFDGDVTSSSMNRSLTALLSRELVWPREAIVGYSFQGHSPVELSLFKILARTRQRRQQNLTYRSRTIAITITRTLKPRNTLHLLAEIF